MDNNGILTIPPPAREVYGTKRHKQSQLTNMRSVTRLLLGAVLAVLAVTVSAQCPEVQEDCQFQYTNIRLESSTPSLSSLHGGYDPGNPGDVIGSPPTDGVLLDETATPFTAQPSASYPSNPFSNVDLSSFSAEDLEARRQLLLAILEQTNAELGISPSTAKSLRAAAVDPVEAGDVVVMKGEDDFEDAGQVQAMDVVVETEPEEVAGDVVVEDVVVETQAEAEDVAPAEPAATVTEDSSSFFKKLIGGSSNPTSSATTIPVVAGALALLMAL